MLRILAVSSQDGLLMRPQCIHSEKSLFDPFRSATSTCHDFLYALLAAHSTTLSIWYCSYYRINWHPYGLAKLFAKYKLIVWLHASLTDASSPSPRPVSAFPIFTLRIILVETDTKTWRNNKSCEQQISQLPRGRGEARILQRISVTVTINYSNRFFG